MPVWICTACAVERPETERPPERCPVCEDERQYVPDSGQTWTTLAELADRGTRGSVRELEPGVHAISVEPEVGIGQQAVLVAAPRGNLLWEPTGYVDDDLEAAVRDLGGVAAIASSHPHMHGVQLEWSRRFDDAPVHVNAADREWVQRDGAAIRTWGDRLEVLPGVVLHRFGGHFPGSAVAHLVGSDGRGVVLCGDTALVGPDRRLSFQRSYPNRIPLSAPVVQRLADAFAALEFDRLVDNFGTTIPAGAAQRVQDSATRHIRWVRGDFDHLT